MKTLLIVFHTQSGASQLLAEAAAAAAREESDVQIRLLRAMEAGAQDLLSSDGIMLVSPENFGYLSGGMKDFFDRTFYACEPGETHRPYMLVISCGNDGTGAVRQVERIVKGYPFKAIAEPLIVKGVPTKKGLEDAADRGSAFALGLEMGIY